MIYFIFLSQAANHILVCHFWRPSEHHESLPCPTFGSFELFNSFTSDRKFEFEQFLEEIDLVLSEVGFELIVEAPAVSLILLWDFCAKTTSGVDCEVDASYESFRLVLFVVHVSGSVEPKILSLA